MAFTEEQLRTAAKKAYAAGDTAAAEELFREAQKLQGSTAAAIAPPAAPTAVAPPVPGHSCLRGRRPAQPDFRRAGPGRGRPRTL